MLIVILIPSVIPEKTYLHYCDLHPNPSGKHSCDVFRIIVPLALNALSSCRVSSFDDSLKEVIKLLS